MSIRVLIVLIICCVCRNAYAITGYIHESIQTPPTKHNTDQIDGMCHTPKGDLVVALPCGEIWKLNAKEKSWSLFAEGLHNPLGILAIGEDDFIVTQRPELTRIKDLDGDGKADLYLCLTDQFGLSGNYHEFNFTPIMNDKNDVFFSLGTASDGAGIRQIVRGEYKKDGRSGRMFSAVPYRGWIMRYNLDTEKTKPWSSGHRTANGLGFDADGNMFATDNQGDWVGASCLFHVLPGRFYGHAASLNWYKGVKKSGLSLGAEKLDKLRTRPAIIFPYGLMSNSPTQPVLDTTNGKFGPFAGQLFIGEMNFRLLLRVMLEKVDGQFQGAVATFYKSKQFPYGSNRLSFAPDGSLIVGHTKHTWPGGNGLTKITFTNVNPFEVLKTNLTKTGFKLTFTRPAHFETAKAKETYSVKRFWYDYHEDYGSGQMEASHVEITDVRVSRECDTVDLDLKDLKPWYVYEIRMNKLKSFDGVEMDNRVVYYTLNRLLENNPQAPPRQWNMEVRPDEPVE